MDGTILENVSESRQKSTPLSLRELVINFMARNSLYLIREASI